MAGDVFTHEQFKRLLKRQRRGLATQEEERLLRSYYELSAAEPDVLENLPENERERIRQGIVGRLFTPEGLPLESTAPPIRVHGLRRLLPYAAAAVAFFALAIGVWFATSDHRSGVGLGSAEIPPGGNRATLTLADGRVINLDESQTGIVVGTDDISYQDGVSAVVMLSESEASKNMLSLTTPKGGTYQITLPDGSKVWLNAASTLKYPSRFSGDTREVVLEGEAFFEIKEMQGTRDTRVPFHVQTSGQTVEVLGTEFNISAYPDEPETKTTLVGGRVRVSAVGANNDSPSKSGVTIAPGQQATTRGTATAIDEVDVSQFTSWKDGEFNLDGVDFRETMRRLARWYDVEVVYDASVPDDLVSGGWISRGTPLQTVLKVIEQSGLVRFTVKGRTIYVSK